MSVPVVEDHGHEKQVQPIKCQTNKACTHSFGLFNHFSSGLSITCKRPNVSSILSDLLHFLSSVASVQGNFVEPLEPVAYIRSLTDSQTRLPCQYKVEGEAQMVQVTWSKELPEGTEEMIILAHYKEGQMGTSTL